MKKIVINPLKDAIFVFGSNLAGLHNKGLSELALRHYGARHGLGVGFSGQSYALPTHDNNLNALPLGTIHAYIKNFLLYAKEHRNLFFMVNRLSFGSNDDDIAMLFNRVPDNVWLPGKWLLKLNHLDRARLLVEGDKIFNDRSFIESTLIENTKFWNRKFELITGNTVGPGTIAEEWCRKEGLPWTPFTSDIDKFGEYAEKVKHFQMAWYATHLIAYWDGESTEMKHLIEHASIEGLRVKVHPVMSHVNKLGLVG